MQPFSLTKYINNNYRNIEPKELKTNAAIWFNKICKKNYRNIRHKLLKTNAAVWFNKMYKQQL
jgi:hypothetical protein